MILDSDQDRQMLLAIMKDANIKGAAAVPFALLMERVASAKVTPPMKPGEAQAVIDAAAKAAAAKTVMAVPTKPVTNTRRTK